MIDVDKVLKTVAEIADFDNEETSKCKLFASLAANHIEALCKEEVKEKEEIKKQYENNLVLLAAAYANLLIVSKNSNKEPTGSFAGNGYRISIKQHRKIKNAEKLFDKCRALSAKLLNDEGFTFYTFAGQGLK